MGYVNDEELKRQRDEAIAENMRLFEARNAAMREMRAAQAEHQRLSQAMQGFGCRAGDEVDAAWRANAVCIAADRIELDHPHVPGHVIREPRKKLGKPCPGCALRDALLAWRPMGKP